MAQPFDAAPRGASGAARVLQTLLALSFLSGCGSVVSAAPSEGSVPVAVQTVVAESRAVPQTLRLTGALLASREVHVAADGAGKIAGTFVERGDAVREGEPLVRLDVRARNDETEARTQVSRTEEETAANALVDAVILAPFSGVVAERGVELGEHVVPGTRVATLVDLASLRLELAVPEPAHGAVQKDGALVFTVAGFPERRFAGRVLHVGPVVRRASRDEIIEASVDNADGLLRPGMLAQLEIEVM